MPRTADELVQLRRREIELNLEPDWEIDAFIKEAARMGKQTSIQTDYILRLLGLEVRDSRNK